MIKLDISFIGITIKKYMVEVLTYIYKQNCKVELYKFPSIYSLADNQPSSQQ